MSFCIVLFDGERKSIDPRSLLIDEWICMNLHQYWYRQSLSIFDHMLACVWSPATKHDKSIICLHVMFTPDNCCRNSGMDPWQQSLPATFAWEMAILFLFPLHFLCLARFHFKIMAPKPSPCSGMHWAFLPVLIQQFFFWPEEVSRCVWYLFSSWFSHGQFLPTRQLFVIAQKLPNGEGEGYHMLRLRHVKPAACISSNCCTCNIRGRLNTPGRKHDLHTSTYTCSWTCHEMPMIGWCRCNWQREYVTLSLLSSFKLSVTKGFITSDRQPNVFMLV